MYALEMGYDIAIQFDGDGQHDENYLTNLTKPIIEGQADIVIGSRFLEKNGFQSSFLRRLGISFFSKLIKLLTHKKIYDVTSGFRACNKKVILHFSKSYPIDYPEPEAIVISYKNNFKILEVPVLMNERMYGKSSINGLQSVYYMFKVTIAILISAIKDKNSVK